VPRSRYEAKKTIYDELSSLDEDELSKYRQGAFERHEKREWS